MTEAEKIRIVAHNMWQTIEGAQTLHNAGYAYEVSGDHHNSQIIWSQPTPRVA